MIGTLRVNWVWSPTDLDRIYFSGEKVHELIFNPFLHEIVSCRYSKFLHWGNSNMNSSLQCNCENIYLFAQPNYLELWLLNNTAKQITPHNQKFSLIIRKVAGNEQRILSIVSVMVVLAWHCVISCRTKTDLEFLPTPPLPTELELLQDFLPGGPGTPWRAQTENEQT